MSAYTILRRPSSTNADFLALVKRLDKELAVTDGDEHSFYDQFNKIADIKHVVILYENDIAVSCGALKQISLDSMEVKRMYTLSEYRGKGFASAILAELEKWASEEGYNKCILETGKRQPAAIRLYERNGYRVIP